jgi:hypothetical protein
MRRAIERPPVHRSHALRVSLALAACFLALELAPSAGAKLQAPTPLAPAAGVTTDAVPAFAWKPVGGADQYEFQVAADAGFNSQVLGRGQDDFLTKNARATLKKTVPNGTYWWRVRAIGAGGGASPWSAGRSFKKLWAATTTLQAPVDGAAVVYPATPLKLTWAPVPGARNYLVSIAYDRDLGSLVPGSTTGSGPAETTATAFTRAAALAPGTYYWGVTPVDAEGNRGVRSAVHSFTWLWPSATTARVTDLNNALEVYDPQFSWDAVAGAARYEVEVNPSQDFAPGSKVCCTGTTIGTSLSPTTLLKDNRYYWRVRAIDVDGNAGDWNVGPSFTKTFDKVAPAGPVTGTSIKNLHMRDNVTDDVLAADADHDLGNGFQTTVPVVSWDPVPGASSYEVQVAGWIPPSGGQPGACAWATSTYVKKTSVTAWTPLGNTLNNPIVYASFAKDFPSTINPGTYCVRVSARSDRVGLDEVLGDPTYLKDGTGVASPAGPAFTFTGWPSGGEAACAGGYMCSGGYLTPQVGSIAGTTPFFTWSAVSGAQSYYVVVAKDQNFSNIVDEGFTRIPAYAPRNFLVPTTYSDETTSYYWAVLPSTAADGATALPLDLGLASPATFQKQSSPPALLAPANGTTFSAPPTFRWSPAPGARRYRLQVSQDPSFGTLLDDVTTDSTAYTTNTTYPADTVLYWRVRADDENGIGLTWSPRPPATMTIQKQLPLPQLSGDNPLGGDFIPTWSWAPVAGAVAYDVSADLPNGTHRDVLGLRMPVLTPAQMYGTGIFSWRVRAEFPKSPSGMTPGPYTAARAFTRTLGEPTGAQTDANVDHVLMSWNAKPQVRAYEIQISGQPSFVQPVEVARTDNTSYAPLLKFFPSGTFDTGHFYWRVAAVDEGNNLGDFTPIQEVRRPRRITLAIGGALRRRRIGLLSVTVRNFESGSPVAGVAVKVSGAGIRPRRLRTTAAGTLLFRVRPRRTGTVLIRASASGYQPARASARVR